MLFLPGTSTPGLQEPNVWTLPFGQKDEMHAFSEYDRNILGVTSQHLKDFKNLILVLGYWVQ